MGHGRTEAVKGRQGKTQGAWTSGVKQVESCVMTSDHGSYVCVISQDGLFLDTVTKYK